MTPIDVREMTTVEIGRLVKELRIELERRGEWVCMECGVVLRSFDGKLQGHFTGCQHGMGLQVVK